MGLCALVSHGLSVCEARMPAASGCGGEPILPNERKSPSNKKLVQRIKSAGGFASGPLEAAALRVGRFRQMQGRHRGLGRPKEGGPVVTAPYTGIPAV